MRESLASHQGRQFGIQLCAEMLRRGKMCFYGARGSNWQIYQGDIFFRGEKFSVGVHDRESPNKLESRSWCNHQVFRGAQQQGKVFIVLKISDY
jgi:hypothetical protein